MAYRFVGGSVQSTAIIGLFGLFFGCASTSSEHDVLMGEGFQSSLPKKGTRVVVWGNHSGAVSCTLGWLKDHHILGGGSAWIEKEFDDPGFSHRTRAEQKAQVLAAAHSAGVPLVLFAQVDDNQLGRKFDFINFSYQPMKIFGVEIRGMNTETGDVVFGAKAWNSEPLVESEQIVLDLTTFALKKAWNETDPLLQIPETIIDQNPPEKEVTVAMTYQEEKNLATEDPQREIVEPVSSEDETSLGLQVASGALSLLYTPLKIVYAGLGGLMGGMAYLVTAGNEYTAQSIWDASVQGTYWLNANHLQGKEAIYFKGEPSPYDSIHHARKE